MNEISYQPLSFYFFTTIERGLLSSLNSSSSNYNIVLIIDCIDTLLIHIILWNNNEKIEQRKKLYLPLMMGYSEGRAIKPVEQSQSYC